MVSRALDVLYVNAAAQRLLHPERIRRGEPLPDPWPSFSLQEYARRLFEPSVALRETAHPDDDHTIVVRGVTTRDRTTGAILLEDVSAGERRRRAEREFVANAAHELLTPLTGIISAAHVLETGAKEVPQDRDRFIGHIARECDRLAQVARALLVLARAQSEEQPPRLDVVALRELLDESVRAAGDELPVQAIIECAHDLTVFVDCDLIALALVNLVRNAATHGSGGVVITAVRVGQQTVSVDIVDAAARMDPDSLPRAERRFVSGAGRDSGGYGLGLSIARQSIEAIGGTLTLTAGEGDGVTARIDVFSGTAD